MEPNPNPDTFLRKLLTSLLAITPDTLKGEANLEKFLHRLNPEMRKMMNEIPEQHQNDIIFIFEEEYSSCEEMQNCCKSIGRAMGNVERYERGLQVVHTDEKRKELLKKKDANLRIISLHLDVLAKKISSFSHQTKTTQEKMRKILRCFCTNLIKEVYQSVGGKSPFWEKFQTLVFVLTTLTLGTCAFILIFWEEVPVGGNAITMAFDIGGKQIAKKIIIWAALASALIGAAALIYLKIQKIKVRENLVAQGFDFLVVPIAEDQEKEEDWLRGPELRHVLIHNQSM